MGIINAECGKTVRIAYQGENKRQKVRFDLADIMTEFPGGTAVLAILRNGDETVVPASMTEMDGTSLLWTVTAWECEHDGFLYAQVTYATADGVVAKDKKYRFDIKDSLIVGGVEPETWEDYVGQLVTAAAGVNDAISSAMDTLDAKVADAQAAQNAAEIAQGKAEDAQAAAEAAVGQYDDMTAEAEGLAAGEDPTAEIDHMGDHPVLKLGIPAGEKGDPGDPGDPGAPGYSPVAVVTKSGKVATITLIDKNGTTSAQISDGEDGTTAIDDTAGAGDTDKTFSADKLTTMNSELLNEITSLNNSKAPIIIDSTSGAIATFPDGADGLPVESLIAEINPVQDLNGQSSPYPAGGGVNKWNPNDVTAGYIGSDGSTNRQNQTNLEYYTDYIPVLANTVYTVGYNAFASGEAKWISVSWYTSDKTFISRYAVTDYSFRNVTSPANAAYARAGCRTFGHGLESGYFGEGTSTTFAPYENICPITGWTGANVYRTGKNLLNIHGTVYDTQKNPADPIALANYSVIQGWAYNGYVRPNNVTMTIGEDSITMTVPDGTYGVGLIAKVKAGQKYTFSATHNGYVVCGFYTENGTYVSHTAIGTAQSYTVTIPSGAEYAILLVRGIAAGTVTYSNIQFESGEIASTYEPFKASETYPITWEEAGTVYGGTVNPVTGKLIVDRASVDLGTLNWSYDSQYQRFFTVGLVSVIKKGSSGWILPLCSAYKSAVGVSDDKTISAYATTGYVYIKDTSYTDATAFKTALSGVQLVYELATPVEYDLIPTEIRTLLGSNAIWADTGDVAVDYRADTKLWIDGHSGSSITVDSALSSTSENPVQNKVINTALNGKEPKHNTITVSGTTPSITAKAGVRYICGEVSTLTIVVPASGCIDVTFTSGSTPTVLTVTPPTGQTMKWANGFDPSSLDANTTYEINIADGCLGVAGAWT